MLEAYTFDSAGNPVSVFSGQQGAPSAPEVEAEIYSLAFHDGILFTKAVDSPFQTREYLNGDYLVDSLSSSKDSGRTFHTMLRFSRSGDTLLSVFWLDSVSTRVTDRKMQITYPAGDSILTYRMMQTPGILTEVCRPRGDTCDCADPASPTIVTKYVVENGLMKFYDAGGRAKFRYFWSPFASAPVRKRVREKVRSREGIQAGYTTDGRRAASKRDGITRSATVVLPKR